MELAISKLKYEISLLEKMSPIIVQEKILHYENAIRLIQDFIRIQNRFKIGSIIDILDSYNNFLLKNGYTDTDIISEEPTALDQFLILNK